MGKKKAHEDVLIVGGGMAGLMAALECQKSGLSYTLLEEDQQLGGKLRTILLPNTNVKGEKCDMGPIVIDEEASLFRSLLEEHEIKITPTRQMAEQKAACLPEISEKFRAVIEEDLTRIGKALTTPSKSKELGEFDRISLLDRIRSLGVEQNDCLACGVLLYREFLIPVERVSYLEFLFLIKHARTLAKSEKKYRTVGSHEQIISKIVNALDSDRIHTLERVTSITASATRVRVETASGTAYTSRTVIFAMSPDKLLEIDVQPEFSKQHYKILEGYRGTKDYAAVFVEYVNQFWRFYDYSGFVESVLPYTVKDVSMFPYFFDVSPVSGSDALQRTYLFSSFLHGNFGWEQDVVEMLSEAYQVDESLDPLQVFAVDFSSDEVKRSYVTAPQDRVLTKAGSLFEIQMPKRCFLACAENSRDAYGTVEGSLRSAKKSVEEILSYLENKS